MKRLFPILLLLLCAGPVRAADQPALDLKGARVLVCARFPDLSNLPAVQRLRAAGADVRGGTLAELTWDVARQYQLLIVIGMTVADEGAAPVVERFVEAGGGLLFFKHTPIRKDTDYYAAEAVLKRFGASVPPLEYLSDPTHTYHTPYGFNLPYAYTDDVTARHPVTEGVRAVWYSAAQNIWFHTSPVIVEQPWTVLVRGAPTARTQWVGALNEENVRKPGAFESAPPFIAAREYGAGAIVLIGISPMEMFLGQGLPAYQDIALEKGDGLRPSDLRRLYENALSWLADHGRKAPALGQGELKPEENKWAKPDVPDWSKDPLAGQDLCAKPVRGVVGAHSKLSDGRAAPDALIRKARELGLQWLAFTERLEELTPQKWEELRQICRASSTPEFAALPGLDYADATGTRYTAFGDFEWPPEKVFSADKKRLVGPTWWIGARNPMLGPYDLSHAPLRYWDLSLYTFLAVRTTIAGRQVDDDREAFRHLQGVHDDPFPMAVEMVYDEDQLAAAAARMANFLTLDEPGQVAEFFRTHRYQSSFRGFVSDGPLVTDWRAHNATRITGGQWWLPDTERYRVKLSAHSTAPITDVRIWDGPRLFRRFRDVADFARERMGGEVGKGPRSGESDCELTASETNGIHTITLTMDLPHDQQRQLFAEITDASGKQALTGGLSIRDWLNYRNMCSDRGNSICNGVQVDEYGPYLTGPTAPYHRKMTVFNIFPGYGERLFNLVPPNFDGGIRAAAFKILPQVKAPGFTLAPPDSAMEQRIEQPVASRDGILQDETVIGYFPRKTDAWTAKYPPQDLRDVVIRSRFLDIAKRAHDPGVVMVEGTLRFNQPQQLDELLVGRVAHTAEPGQNDQFAIRTPATSVAGGVGTTPYSARAGAAPGSYACVFPSLWGASGFMALDDGYRLTLNSKNPNTRLGIELADLPRAVNAGEEIRYRYLIMTGSLRDGPNTANWERFAETMGLRGKPAYEVKDVKAGGVKGTKFLLELVPDDGGFAGTITAADLPIRLPVRVAGMNPNWTFAWFDLDRKEWHPSAVDPVISQGYFTFDTRRGAHRFFAGHPVLADNSDVRIGVLSDARREIRATVNNVGDQPVQVRIRLNPALGHAEPQLIALAAGEMRACAFRWKP